jgi:hypothetical protein
MTYLPPTSIKFRIVDQELFCLFKYFKTVKLLIYLCGQNKNLKLLIKGFLVFCFLEYNKNTPLLLEKTKKQGIHLGLFLSFHTSVFLVIFKIIKGILVFLSWKNNFFFKNVVDACSLHATV